MTYFDDANEREKSRMNEWMNKYIGQDKFRKIKVEKEIKRYQHKNQWGDCRNLNESYKLFIQGDIMNGTNLSLITDVENFLHEKII